MVGNIHEKKSVVKNFRLSRLQTIKTALFLCGKKIFVYLIFIVPGVQQNFFHANFFPNYVSF